MNCPACTRSLTTREVESLTVARCEGCAGLWLDNAASQRISAGKLSEAERTFVLEIEREILAPEATEAPASEGVRACPTCSEPMAEVAVPHTDVQVDVCGAHGTYFDARELLRVYQAIEIKNIDDDEAAGEFAAELAHERAQSALRGSLLSRALGWLRN